MADTDKIEEVPTEEQAPQNEAGENEEVRRADLTHIRQRKYADLISNRRRSRR
jgi:hypothetical protein